MSSNIEQRIEEELEGLSLLDSITRLAQMIVEIPLEKGKNNE